MDFKKTGNRISAGIHLTTGLSAAAGAFLDPAFFGLTGVSGSLSAVDVYARYFQTEHAVLRNYGVLGYTRYFFENLGPSLRQYLFANDLEERPFTRIQRNDVYRKAKNEPSSMAYGSRLLNFEDQRTILHSAFPKSKKELVPYSLTFGEGSANPYTITKPTMISAMSYGALGKNAVLALSRGAKMAGIPICTGEGGFPKYHLEGGADLIFQMGTAKFGVNNPDFTLNDQKLEALANLDPIKMIEIKFSQGAKPGKGGLLPKEKITEEIAELRGLPLGEDIISPGRHVECHDAKSTIDLIERVKEVSQLPVGVKMCIPNPKELGELVRQMKKQEVFPDYFAVDGMEGGTGAAPKSFLDNVGMPLYHGLDKLLDFLTEEEVREEMKITASGKLVTADSQFFALAYGADAVYTARGFMLALGCIQALECNKGSCPTGITTHDPKLMRGLNIKEKSQRIVNYVNNVEEILYELLAATGNTSFADLDRTVLRFPA